ncbi:MAG: adenosylmethionine decarboxylase [Sedimentisphaerales bacterium]|nr:adenosylmethionine decarboxylase [Sedimentisphaerales bacterium]
MQKTPTGIHCILELYGCPSGLLNDRRYVCNAIRQASRQSMSTLLDLTSHQFHPQGVTAVGLLAESHISVHTWPELGYAAVDVFTCGQTAQPQRACEFLIEQFGARQHRLKTMPRGGDCTSKDSSRSVSTTVQEADLCPARG